MPHDSLAMVKPKGCCLITELKMQEKQKKRMIDLGFYVGNSISCDRISPGASLIAFRVNGTTIALRKNICEQIGVMKNE